MKKNIALILSVILIPLLCQSCFEIKESIKINKDGSGTFSMSIDLSQVKMMLEGFGGGDSGEGSPFADMEAEFESTKEILQDIAGISNIRFISENDGYVVETSFDFENIEALNKGMAAVYNAETESSENHQYYILTKSSFERTEAHNFLDQVKEELISDEIDVEGMDLASLFSEVAYVNEITFDGRSIKKVKSGMIQLSQDKSSAKNTYYIFNDEIEQALEYKLRVR